MPISWPENRTAEAACAEGTKLVTEQQSEAKTVNLAA
jgi:hypothetical protein